MAWQQVYQLDLTYSDVPVAIPYQFATNQIIVEISTTRTIRKGHRAGWIWSVVNNLETGETKSKPLKVYLNRQSLDIPRLKNYYYSLEFLPLYWMSYLNLSFFEDTNSRLDELEAGKTENVSANSNAFPGIIPGIL